MRYVLITLVTVALWLPIARTAAAIPRTGRSSGRAAAAMRQQEIARLQKQLENARSLLEQFKNRSSHSESEIAEARTRAISARQSLEQAAATHRESQKKLDEIEHRILEAQSDDSEFGRALTAFEDARRAMDIEMHRVLKWPAPAADEREAERLKELGTLTTEQRAALKADAKYQKRVEELTDASESLSRIRNRLFSGNPEWKRIHDDDVTAAKEKIEAERSRGGAANDRLEADRSLRSSAEIAASLQQTITQLEARLRSLGAASNNQKPGKSPGSGSGRK